MRRLFRLIILAGAAYAIWSRLVRKDKGPTRRALVAWSDGSSVVLDGTSPELDRLAAAAAPALRP